MPYSNIQRVITDKAKDPKWSIPIGAGLLATVISGIGGGLFTGGLVAGGMWLYRTFK